MCPLNQWITLMNTILMTSLFWSSHLFAHRGRYSSAPFQIGNFSVTSRHMETRTVLVTGGAGYIGSHTIVCLLENNFDVVVVDNLCNSSAESLRRVREISGCRNEQLKFYHQDLCDAAGLERVFVESPRFECCIHFAGLKAVGDSVREPLSYYRNNLDSTLVLLQLMSKYNCRSIVFSSSATVSV